MPTKSSSLPVSRFFASDPRYYQIAVLAALLIYGVGWLSFDTARREITILLGTALITQFLCGKVFSVSPFDPRSALISGLSLCLLLRTNSTLLLILTAVITIASKFVLKWNHKHIFNPTNFGIVAMLALSAVPQLMTASFAAVALRLGKFHINTLQIFLEFIVRTPVMIFAAYFYGVSGVLAARFICGFYAVGIVVVLVRRLVHLSVVEQLLAPWRPLVASAVMGIAVMQAVPFLSAQPGQVALALGTAATVAAGGLIYGLMVLLLWVLSGRPDGAEKIIADKVVSGLALVRRRFA